MELPDCGDLMSSARTFRRYRHTPRAAFAPRRLPDAPARSTHDVEIRPRDAGLDDSLVRLARIAGQCTRTPPATFAPRRLPDGPAAPSSSTPCPPAAPTRSR